MNALDVQPLVFPQAGSNLPPFCKQINRLLSDTLILMEQSVALSKFFLDFRNFTSTVAKDASYLRASVDRLHSHTDNTHKNDGGTIMHASSLLDEMENQVNELQMEINNIGEYPALHPPFTFDQILQTCHQMYALNEEWMKTVETQLEQYGYVKKREYLNPPPRAVPATTIPSIRQQQTEAVVSSREVSFQTPAKSAKKEFSTIPIVFATLPEEPKTPCLEDFAISSSALQAIAAMGTLLH